MAEEQYRVVWEERPKLKCSCCTEDNHEWKSKSLYFGNDLKGADKYELMLWDQCSDPEYSYELRAIYTQQGEVEWQARDGVWYGG